MPLPNPLPHDRRAQSEILGVVLLIGVVVVAVGLLAMYGTAAAETNKDRIAVERAENGLEQFDTRASRVALGESEVQRLDVGVTGTRGSLDSRPNDGWIRVSIVNASTGNVEEVVVDRSLGAVTYTLDDTTVAYQGGGVWRKDGDGAVMLSRPEFHFEGGTLTLPIVVTGGDGAVYSDVVIRPDGSVTQVFPDVSRNFTNKIEKKMVRVTIQSDYYEAWGRYLEVETGYDVDYEGYGPKTVTVEFDGLGTGFGRHGGIIATSATGEVRLAGTGIYIDSYDGSEGYAASNRSAGLIVAVNDVVNTGTSQIEGDVVGGNEVDLGGNTYVSGTAYWGAVYDEGSNADVSKDEQRAGTRTIDPIDSYVLGVVNGARGTNDNNATSVIVDNKLTGSGTLTAGTYYLEEMVVGQGETLTIDTSNGDVVIAVEDDVTIVGVGNADSQKALVNVTGPGTVEVVVLGAGGGRLDFEMGKNAEVNVPGENSGQFRVYGTSEFDAELTSDNSGAQLRFEGALYAPAGLNGGGSITVGQGEFYGILVTGTLDINQNAKIHYDENLASGWFPGEPFSSHLEYLHVSVHPIEVTSR